MALPRIELRFFESESNILTIILQGPVFPIERNTKGSREPESNQRLKEIRLEGNSSTILCATTAPSREGLGAAACLFVGIETAAPNYLCRTTFRRDLNAFALLPFLGLPESVAAATLHWRRNTCITIIHGDSARNDNAN